MAFVKRTSRQIAILTETLREKSIRNTACNAQQREIFKVHRSNLGK